MKILAAFHRRYRWINLPTATLVALLQRSPVVQVVQVADEMIKDSPIGAVLRSTAAAAAALGALNSLAGATTLVSSPLTSPVAATVGTAISTTAITVNGTVSEPGSWQITTAIPAGLVFTNSSGSTHLTAAGEIDVPNGVLFLSGTPTAAGTYNVGLIAYEFAAEGGINSPTYTFTIVVSASSSAPSFTTSPTSATVNVGQSVTFTAAASGSPTYAWQKNGSPISGATSATYTISSPALTDAGSYSVIATNSGGSTTSAAATLTVVSTTAAPVFTSQPLSQLQVDQGVTVNFNATAVGGTVSYAWQFGSGTPISNGVGADGNTYSGVGTSSLVVVANGSSAVYKVVATNTSGTTTSSTATMTVASSTSMPVFTTQPLTQSATVGQNVTLTAVATNASTYQWYFGSTALSSASATTTSLVLNNVQVSSSGTYFCIATGPGSTDVYGDPIAGASTNSSNATLTVTAVGVPVFTSQPTSTSVNVGATAMFTATATGATSYQWTFNGANITGNASATTSTLTLATVALYAAGTYAVVATGAGGPVTSNSVTLSVIATAAPSFTIPASPSSVTVATGRTAVFNATAAGTPTPTYQWTLNGSTTIPGAAVTNDPILMVNGATSADAGTYTCTATNSIGTPATTSATLAVTTTSNPGYLTNLSGRGVVGVGAANAVIGGFVISGSASKQLLLRGMGPGLNTEFGLGGYLVATELTLFNSSQAVVGQNTTWGGTSALMTAQATLGAYSVPNNSLDSMLYPPPVAPGGYSAAVSGVGTDTGVAAVEVYDADTPPLAAKLVNVSVRVPVGTGGNILVGGFVIGGSTAETVLIRALGPGLTYKFGLGGTLAQPVLTLFLGLTPIYSNTVWGGDPVLISAEGTVGGYGIQSNSADSMLLVTLPPGGYTAQISGANSTTGIATVEIYELQ